MEYEQPRASTHDLRELPHSSLRFFCSFTPLQKFINLKINDKTPDATKPRLLPVNELLALALNELAASWNSVSEDAPASTIAGGGGFFQHLPNRNSASKATERHTSSKPESGPFLLCRLMTDKYRPSYPSLVFTNFSWTEHERANLVSSSHRTRYMACDYLANRIPGSAPISCFQVAGNKGYPLYRTSHTSHVVIVTGQYMYLLTARQLQNIIGLWPNSKRNPNNLDRTDQLDTFPGLWKDDPSYEHWQQFSPYRHETLESLYLAITQSCRPSGFTSSDLFRIVPRPLRRQPDYRFGTPTPATELGQSASFGKSRRGQRKKKAQIGGET